MQNIIYQVHIEDGIVLDDAFLVALDITIEGITESNVIRSKVEDEDTVVENGEWEDTEE